MIPPSVLQAYSLDPEQVTITPIAIGLIHQTYKVVAHDKKYIVQSLNSFLASPGITDDMNSVTQHMLGKGLAAPEVAMNKDQRLLTVIEGLTWRAQTYLGGKSYEVITTSQMAYEAGKQLGIFHRELQDLDYFFKSTRPNHPTAAYIKTLHEHIGSEPELRSKVSSEVTYIQERVSDLLLPNNLPQRVIHGDPKISNFLFNDNDAFAIIDLDTCSRGSVLFDLGDAFRSWCGLEEDNQDNTFNIEYFEAGLRGYFSEHSLHKQEIHLIPQSIELITLELATRFCNDYFADSYFGYSQERYSSRREHNLARMRGQIAQHKSIVAQRDIIERIMKKYL